MSIVWDGTIQLGHVVQAIGFAVGAVVFVMKLDNKVGRLQQDVALVQTEVKKLVEVVVQLGKQDIRLEALEKRLGRLEG